MITFAIISISDVDPSITDDAWQTCTKLLVAQDITLEYKAVVEKERPFVAGEILRCCDDRHIDVVLTIGGTLLGKNDIVPEATQDVCTRELAGISALLRDGRDESAFAISRHVAMQRGTTLVINLPSTKDDIQFCLEKLCPVLRSAVESAHS